MEVDDMGLVLGLYIGDLAFAVELLEWLHLLLDWSLHMLLPE